jgi:DNA-binding GntR family transcriptional regulator
MESIERQPLRDRVYGVLRSRLATGAWQPGTRLSDNAIARDLSISRTPVRESLLRLEAEGFLTADHHRGFFVPELTASDVEEIYPILWTLEILALRIGRASSRADVAALELLNERLASASNPMERLEADRAFHEELTGGASNERLQTILAAQRTALARYELAFMAETSDVGVSVGEHRELIRELGVSDIDRVAAILERHWRRGMRELLEYLAGD